MTRPILLCVLSCLFNQYEAARILAVYPVPSISHQVVFRPLMHELEGRGHEVVVLTTDPAFRKGQAPKNLAEIDLHDISYEVWRKKMETKFRQKELVGKQIRDSYRLCLYIFLQQVQTPEVQNIIKNKKNNFDLIFVETMPRFGLAFSHVIKAPVISFSSLGSIFDNYHIMGAPIHRFLYPQSINTRVHNMTIWDKVKQLHYLHSIMKNYYDEEEYENAKLRELFGASMPATRALQNNVDILFLKVHPIWEGVRPVPPGVVYEGGLHQNPQKELPKDLKAYLDAFSNGVIYVSFETNVDPSVLPPERIQNMVPYDVLWKWNEDVLPGLTKNIKISKWLPQSDLSKLKNSKL